MFKVKDLEVKIKVKNAFNFINSVSLKEHMILSRETEAEN